jgi:glutaredoxin 2
MQLYLYDWWPVRRRQRRLALLAEVPVEVVARHAT